MVADEHSLMKQGGVGALISKFSSLLIAQMINLTISLYVCVIATLFPSACKTRFRNCAIQITRSRRTAWLLLLLLMKREEEEKDEKLLHARD